MILDIIIPFISILLAEFGDKTQIAVLSMSSKFKNQKALFIGVFLGFLVVDGLAVYFGNYLINYIPLFWIKIISGLIFLIIGLIGLFNKEEEDDEEIKFNKKAKSTMLVGFTVIFFAEMGDKSQITSALFGTIYNAELVLLGVMLSLSFLTILAMYLGKYLFKKFKIETINKYANYLFIILGIITIVSLYI